MKEPQKMAIITFQLRDDLSREETADALIGVMNLSDVFRIEAAGEVKPEGNLTWTAMILTDGNGVPVAAQIRKVVGIVSAEVTFPVPQP